MLREAVSRLPAEGRALLVLDEACAALQTGTLSEPLLREELSSGGPQGWEVVLTGRDPAGWMREEAADYATEMRCIAHPFDRGRPRAEGDRILTTPPSARTGSVL